MAKLETEKQWQYLESRPHSWRQQLYIKGQRIKASDIYSEMILNEETPEETAENWGLPLAAIQEVMEYCQNHQELLKREAREEHHRLMKNRSERNLFKQVIEWIFILFITAIVVILIRNWLRFILIPIVLIFFLRIADRIPILGPKWKWLFGERTLWDWLTLLFIPMALTLIGVQFSVLFTESQGDINVEKARYEITQSYLNLFQKNERDLLTEILKTDLSKLPLLGKSHCRDNKNAALLRNNTLSVLEQLTQLKTSKPSKISHKKYIVEFLHNAGLIDIDKNFVSLRYADMTGSDLVQARLENACLESVSFADPYTSPESSSDLRHAQLQGSDLSGANLARANLRNANLEKTDLTGWASLYKADLRGANLAGAKIDKTTVLSGAIYNTKPIDVEAHQKNPISDFFCHKSAFIFNISGFCMDSIDYQKLKPTVFPKEYYEGDIKNFPKGLTDKLKKGTVRLNQEKLKKLGDQKKMPMEENNTLAFFQ